jgi:streptomycin 3"-adenylyltransferase
VHHFVSGLQHTVGPNLTGIYLHGSLAYGCFNPTQSDIDLLVFTKERMAVGTKRRVAHVLLQYSAHPVPLEVSVLSRDQIVPCGILLRMIFTMGRNGETV